MNPTKFTKELLKNVENGSLSPEWEQENLRMILSMSGLFSYDLEEDSSYFGKTPEDMKRIHELVGASSKNFQAHIWDVYDGKVTLNIEDVNIIMVLLFAPVAGMAEAARNNKLQRQKAVDKRHNAPGGSREKRKAIQEVWAKGNYSSRDKCAYEECVVIKMSQTTARKALINTPDPDPWPAKK